MGLYEGNSEMIENIYKKFKDFDDGFYKIKEICPDIDKILRCDYNIHECNCGECETQIYCDEIATYIYIENNFPSNVCNDCKIIIENG